MREPLVVIPSYMAEPDDVATLLTAIGSVRDKAGTDVEVLVIDDGSPSEIAVAQAEALSLDARYEFYRKKQNTGFSRTVNIGLRRALEEGRDAVLINADLEMDTPDWVKEARETTDSFGKPASVVGALLTYPQSGLIQHAGIYFSLLTRRFGESYKFGPMNLPAALEKRPVPVTGAFQYIRHDCLEAVGLYDEAFKMGYEDIDYCVRVFLTKERQCVYTPRIRAWHHESMFRGGQRKSDKLRRWEASSWMHFGRKWADQSFSEFIPFW